MPLVRSISGGADRFASPAAVLGLIGRATGHLSAKRRPSDEVRRAAVAAASAIAEIVREVQPQFGSELWAVEVPHDISEIGRRAGGSSAEIDSAISLLLDTGCLIAVTAGPDRRLRLSEETFAEHPALARVSWEAVREHLGRVGASLMPAQAVLREIGVLSGNRLDTDTGPWVEISLPRLMEGTLFRRTAVSKALAELETAGLVGRSARAGREHGCQLLPAAFGRGDILPRVPDPAPRSSTPQPVATPQAPVVSAPAPSASTPAVTLRFAGSEVHIHGGLACDVRPGPDGVPVLEIRPASS